MSESPVDLLAEIEMLKAENAMLQRRLKAALRPQQRNAEPSRQITTRKLDRNAASAFQRPAYSRR